LSLAYDTLEGVECHHFHAQSAFALVLAVVVVFAAAVGADLALPGHYKVSAGRAYFVAAVAVDDAEPLLLGVDFAALVEPGAFLIRTDDATCWFGFCCRSC
jgi:hypothetical protein